MKNFSISFITIYVVATSDDDDVEEAEASAGWLLSKDGERSEAPARDDLRELHMVCILAQAPEMFTKKLLTSAFLTQ